MAFIKRRGKEDIYRCYWYEGYRINKKGEKVPCQHSESTGTSVYDDAEAWKRRKEDELYSKETNTVIEEGLFDDLKKMFFVRLKAQHRTDKAIKTFKNSFKQFERFCPIKYTKEITSLLWDEYCVKQENRVIESTLNQHLRCLKAIGSFAVIAKHTKTPLLRGVKKFGVPDIVREWFFEPDQLKAVFEHIQSRALKSVFYLGYYAGLGPADAINCKWAQIDFKKNLISFMRKKTLREKPRRFFVPLHEELKAYLLSIKDSSTSEYICAYDDGSLMTTDTAGQWTKKIMRRCGFNEATLYTLRHTFISQCIMAGVDSAVVSQWVGHFNNNQIRAYIHLSPSFSQQAINKLPSIK